MSDGSGDSYTVGDWHIPTAVAVAFWAASGLAVIGYTLTAYKETVSGDSDIDDNPPGIPVPSSPSTGGGGDFTGATAAGATSSGGGGGGGWGPGASPAKPNKRGKFTPSPDAPKGKKHKLK